MASSVAVMEPWKADQPARARLPFKVATNAQVPRASATTSPMRAASASSTAPKRPPKIASSATRHPRPVAEHLRATAGSTS